MNLPKSQFVSNLQAGVLNVAKNRVFQIVAVVLIVVGLIYYAGRKSAITKTKQDQVKLPSGRDTVSTITQEELQKLVEDCHSYFRTFAAIPGYGYFKTQTIKRMLSLTDIELALLNNRYNLRYVPLKYVALTEEIENDWLTSEEPWRSRILARLKSMPRT